MDPTSNSIWFELAGERDEDEPLWYDMPARADDAVRQAWRRARRDRPEVAPADVAAIRCRWAPCDDDLAFLSETFPDADAYCRYDRPATEAEWAEALAVARADAEAEAQDDGAGEPAPGEVAAQVERWGADLAEAGIRVDGPDDDGWTLLPALVGESDERLGPMLELVRDRLYATVGVFGRTPRGTIGWRHLTHEEGEVAGVPAAVVLAMAADNLVTGLTMECVDDEPTPDSVVELHREGGGAAAVLALPTFGEQLGAYLGTDRLVVGVPCQDVAWVTGADSAGVDSVHRYVREHTHTDYLVPSVYLVDGGRISLLGGADGRPPRPPRQFHGAGGGTFVTANPVCPEPASGADGIALSDVWPMGAGR